METFFAGLSTWMLWLISLAAVAPLVYGADRAVTGASRLAAVLGMSPVIIGATVVSLGTTSPECFVSVTAAFQGKPGLALGNGVGSIICDTALVFGLSCVLVRLPKDRFILNRHGWLQLGSGVLLAATVAVLALFHGSLVGVTIPRMVGILFLALLAAYMYLSVKWARMHPEAVEMPDLEADGRSRWVQALLDLGLCAIGLALVLVGSKFLVGGATELCLRFNVPQSVLAVTLVALSTSLPELATAIAAIVKGHTELLVGNVVGADILNVLFVIGASALAVPLEVPVEFYTIHIPVMLVALIMLRVWIFIGRDRFHRWQGVPLLALYIGYCVLVVRMGVAAH